MAGRAACRGHQPAETIAQTGNQRTRLRGASQGHDRQAGQGIGTPGNAAASDVTLPRRCRWYTNGKCLTFNDEFASLAVVEDMAWASDLQRKTSGTAGIRKAYCSVGSATHSAKVLVLRALFVVENQSGADPAGVAQTGWRSLLFVGCSLAEVASAGSASRQVVRSTQNYGF